MGNAIERANGLEWLSVPAVAVTVKPTSPGESVAAAEMVRVWDAPAVRLKLAGEALTPAGIPPTVTLADPVNPFKPVSATAVAVEEPAQTVALEG